jgi:hypothetical protein
MYTQGISSRNQGNFNDKFALRDPRHNISVVTSDISLLTVNSQYKPKREQEATVDSFPDAPIGDKVKG